MDTKPDTKQGDDGRMRSRAGDSGAEHPLNRMSSLYYESTGHIPTAELPRSQTDNAASEQEKLYEKYN